MPVTELECAGLPELVDATLKITRELPAGAFLWFRGQTRADYTLTPSLLREGKSIGQVFDREKRMMTRFRQRSLAYWPAGYPQNDWEHLFAMQHHGMPTRLLDWSENLFVAAYFAAATIANEPGAKENPPVVWCLDPIQWNRSAPPLADFGDAIQVLTTSDEEADSYRPETTKRRAKTPIAIFGTHNSNRIVAQRGTFLIWGAESRSLEAVAQDEGATGKLWKLKLTAERPQLAADLAGLGFGETMVYPELPALARELSKTEGWR